MDPLSIAAASFSIAGAIAKASVAIFEVSRDARDAADDLSRVNAELQALSSILDPLTRALSRSPAVPERLASQLQSTLEGCSLVVGQIVELVGRYRGEGAWSKTKWAMFGRGDVNKLRESLEAYKMVLSLGLHLVSTTLQEEIKQDTGAIRDDTQVVRQYASDIKISTDQILARVNSIRNRRGNSSASRVEQWMEQMEVLTSYAETTYQETVVDPGEWAVSDQGRGPEVPESNAASEGRQKVGDDLTTLSQDQVDRLRSLRLQDEGNDALSGRTPAVFSQPTMEHLPSTDIERRPSGTMDSHPSITMKSLPSITMERLPSIFVQGSQPQNKVRGDSRPTSQLPGDFDLDVVVAIDIGELSTAVSWMARDVDGSAIDQWPGGTGPRVPTSVVYNRGGDLSSWGYLCMNDAGPAKALSIEYMPLAELMELIGDPPGSAPLPPPHVDQLRLRMTDFLRELYHHIKATVLSRTRLGAWEEMAVEFHFTLPDLIRMAEPAAVERAMNAFKDILWNAGFCNGERHLAVLGGTESEAVAMAAIPQEAEGEAALIIKIGESNIALAERPEPDDPLLVTFTTSLTTKLYDAFAEMIRERARGYSEVLVVETSRQARRNFTDQVVKALGPEGGRSLTRFNPLRSHPGTGFSGAGPSGLIYRRNPWGSSNRPQLRFASANLPSLFIRMRDPSGTLDVTDVWKTSRLCPYGARNEVAFEVQVLRHQRPRRVSFQFDVTFSFDTQLRGVVVDAGNPRYRTEAKMMCSVRSWMGVDDFAAEKVRERWYSVRTIYFVNVALRLFMMDKNKAGPQFGVDVWDKEGRRVRREAEVVWYCEPPHIVWGRAYIPARRYENLPKER